MAALGRNLICRCRCFTSVLNGIKSPATVAVSRRTLVNPKWRRRFLRQMYERRLEVGPEPERPRSAWINWNYDAEIFGFGKRLGEDFDEGKLRQAFVHRSYLDQENQKRAEIGFGADMSSVQLKDNEELFIKGESISSDYIQAFLRHSLPYLPEEGIKGVHDYLMSEGTLAFVGGYLGIKDLILSQDFPPLVSTLSKTFLAVIGALSESQGVERAEKLVLDFILPQLVGKDINEMCEIVSPMTLLTDMLTAQGLPPPEARLIRSSASRTVMSLYWVGIYCNQELVGEAPGETTSIAEEMAARDALKEIFRTNDCRAPLKFGLRGSSLQLDMEKKNQTIEQYTQSQKAIKTEH